MDCSKKGGYSTPKKKKKKRNKKLTIEEINKRKKKDTKKIYEKRKSTIWKKLLELSTLTKCSGLIIVQHLSEDDEYNYSFIKTGYFEDIKLKEKIQNFLMQTEKEKNDENVKQCRLKMIEKTSFENEKERGETGCKKKLKTKAPVDTSIFDELGLDNSDIYNLENFFSLDEDDFFGEDSDQIDLFDTNNFNDLFDNLYNNDKTPNDKEVVSQDDIEYEKIFGKFENISRLNEPIFF